MRVVVHQEHWIRLTHQMPHSSCYNCCATNPHLGIKPLHNCLFPSFHEKSRLKPRPSDHPLQPLNPFLCPGDKHCFTGLTPLPSPVFWDLESFFFFYSLHFFSPFIPFTHWGTSIFQSFTSFFLKHCFKISAAFVTMLLLFYVMVFWLWGKWDFSSLTRDRTHMPRFGRWSLNLWTAREVPKSLFLQLEFTKFLWFNQ